ncbi:MAG: hypothetical protein R2713_12205 [Ilumatobacteraceae bacterium]|nr:hypothetical protein [Acidimicrobiales bacterium]MCB9392246.1 hypothetical protein [Acidimicrobiaceae bacterium]
MSRSRVPVALSTTVLALCLGGCRIGPSETAVMIREAAAHTVVEGGDGCQSPYCQVGYVDRTMDFTGTSIEQELAFDVGVSTIDVPIHLAPGTGAYLPDQLSPTDGWTVTVVHDYEVLVGDSDDGRRFMPDSAYYTRAGSLGGRIVATVSRTDASTAESLTFRVNECMNMVDDGLCN